MHVAGGMFTQAGYRDAGNCTQVISTNRFETMALHAYAGAIAAAELDVIDADEDYAATMFIGSASGVLVTPSLGGAA
jgi:hypothetical protein